MKTVWVIESINGGYWSFRYGKFKGWLFADKFDHGTSDVTRMTEDVLPRAAEVEPCFLRQVFYYEKG